MASANKLAKWIYENSQYLNLRVEEFTWPQEDKIKIFDFQVKVQIQNEHYLGRGSDKDQELALLKATVESLERHIVRQGKLYSSNGVAAHDNLHEAKSSALNELLERHIFLSFYLSKNPFPEMQKQKIQDEETISLISFVESKNALLKISLVEIDKIGYFCFCCISGIHASPSFGLIVGASVCKSEDDAIFKAVMEAVRTFVYVSKQQSLSINLEEFCRLANPSFDDHGKLALDINYANKVIKNLFTEDVKHRSIRININDVVYNTISSSYLSSIPLYFVQASSNSLQKLFCGHIKKIDINYKAIEQQFGYFNVNQMPHPFR